MSNVKGPVATNKQRYQVSFDVEQLVNGRIVTIGGNKYAVVTDDDILKLVADNLKAKFKTKDVTVEDLPNVGSKN